MGTMATKMNTYKISKKGASTDVDMNKIAKKVKKKYPKDKDKC